MKKILLTLLLSVFFIQGVNAETVKTYLIKDGVDQVDFTGGHTFLLVDADGPIAEIQNNGYISLAVKTWGRSEFTFINSFDFSNYNLLVIDYDFPKTYGTSYAAGNIGLKTNNTIKSPNLIPGSKAVTRTTVSVDLTNVNDVDIIRMELLNLAETSNYKNYPFNIYNIWLESEKVETPIVADTTLNSFYTLYLDKIKSLADYSLENKYTLSAIVIIITFTITGLFIYLFKKGGYRR